MAFSSLEEVNDLLCIIVDVSPVIISVLDGLLRGDQLANVNCR
jgi:hypothetical protein